MTFIITTVAINLLCIAYLIELGILKGPKKGVLITLLAIATTTTIHYRLYQLYQMSFYYIATLLCIIFLLLTSISDLQKKEIPSSYLYITIILGVMMLRINPNITPIESILGAGIGGLLIGLSYATKNAIGQGDGWVILAVGIITGWQMTLGILLIGLILSAIWGSYLLILRRQSKKTKMPFVPFLFLATLVIYLV
ncbi:leader peptidase (prepilin peptidase)/N-methyltransferase [Natranaerovirga hydrolytica]|uniref:Leader peptidase (Prepilin peptidase)/N-methyltransferase n=1 Tax=Natranaerovirga hydrolytica TaxID=680378 RepID=A0A4R1MKM2_9FIRM|nr:prepilin peptidase [Natranaerovirga hydrolytica]TCK93107.1 leader peptidase (prepilin peptidase)/N-methyltransferase [Natranaerovirga hydrolytica]